MSLRTAGWPPSSDTRNLFSQHEAMQAGLFHTLGEIVLRGILELCVCWWRDVDAEVNKRKIWMANVKERTYIFSKDKRRTQ